MSVFTNVVTHLVELWGLTSQKTHWGLWRPRAQLISPWRSAYNGWIDQVKTTAQATPVRWVPRSLPQRAQLPIFGPCLLWPNGWMHRDTSW